MRLLLALLLLATIGCGGDSDCPDNPITDGTWTETAKTVEVVGDIRYEIETRTTYPIMWLSEGNCSWNYSFNGEMWVLRSGSRGWYGSKPVCVIFDRVLRVEADTVCYQIAECP